MGSKQLRAFNSVPSKIHYLDTFRTSRIAKGYTAMVTAQTALKSCMGSPRIGSSTSPPKTAYSD